MQNAKCKIGIYRADWSAKREPPLCKGRWSKSSILTGGVVKERQSLSQKSKIFDSSLYTREPFCRFEQSDKLKFAYLYKEIPAQVLRGDNILYRRIVKHYIPNNRQGDSNEKENKTCYENTAGIVLF